MDRMVRIKVSIVSDYQNLIFGLQSLQTAKRARAPRGYKAKTVKPGCFWPVLF